MDSLQARGSSPRFLSYTMCMVLSRRARLGLAVAGLILIGLAAFALVYAFGPVDRVIEHVPVAPTLFGPPV